MAMTVVRYRSGKDAEDPPCKRQKLLLRLEGAPAPAPAPEQQLRDTQLEHAKALLMLRAVSVAAAQDSESAQQQQQQLQQLQCQQYLRQLRMRHLAVLLQHQGRVQQLQRGQQHLHQQHVQLLHLQQQSAKCPDAPKQIGSGWHTPPRQAQPTPPAVVVSAPAKSAGSAAVCAVCPEQYLLLKLADRGYTVSSLRMSSVDRGFSHTPTAQQVGDYDKVVGIAVRGDDVQELLRLVQEEGRCLSACNKFGESLSHLACRKGNLAALKVILAHGGSLSRCDDLGRIPLHDTCWASTTNWDIVQLHLETDPSLLLSTDGRGWTPLRYIKRGNWRAWRDLVDSVVDTYWPTRNRCEP